MVTLQLEDHEAKILDILLKRASDEFARHGCNDFNVLTELKVGTRPEALAIAQRLREGMVKLGMVDAAYAQEGHGVYLEDWLLMSYLRKRLTGG